MAELYEDWLVSPMTRAELSELSADERAERKRLKKRQRAINYKTKNPEKVKEHNKNYRQTHKEELVKYREEHKEERKEYDRQYREENAEKVKEQQRLYYEEHKEELNERMRQYRQTSAGKKSHTISSWVTDLGLKESPEDLDRIYELRENQELCNACDCVLTRTGKRISTDACCDHDHDTHRFRHIICRTCNTHDNWKKYFC